MDLDHPPELTNYLQKNIILIKKKFGSQFSIKNQDIEIPIKLFMVKNEYNPKLRYYSMVYDIETRDEYLLPFKINFINYLSLEKDNNCYISDITKFGHISGSQMVLFVLKLLKILGAEKAFLYDGTRIECNGMKIDLSFFKLIEKGITFYQKFGFKIFMDPSNHFLKIKYGTTETMSKALRDNLQQMQKIKLSYYYKCYQYILNILFDVIKNQAYDKIIIYLYHRYKPYIYKRSMTKQKVLSLVQEIDTFLGIIKRLDKVYLYQAMIKLFYEDCSQYVQLEDHIFNNLFYGISYNNKHIYLKHIKIFDNLKLIRNESVFEINLRKYNLE